MGIHPTVSVSDAADVQFAAALPIGTILHGIEILSVIGSGGFGLTYKARIANTGQLVAVKEFCPRTGVTRGPDLVLRATEGIEPELVTAGISGFLAEARVLSGLHHPGLVETLDAFQANGTGYIVMRFVSGRPLSDLLASRAGTLQPRTLVGLAQPLLEALNYLHAHGVVHQDIKPANVILQRDGMPVLVDFGAANSSRLGVDAPKIAIASAGYSAPELYMGAAMGTPQSDIYSLGALLYFAAFGAIPPNGYDRLEDDKIGQLTAMAETNEEAILFSAIMTAISVNPEDRYSDAISFWQALNELGPVAPGVARNLMEVPTTALTPKLENTTNPTTLKTPQGTAPQDEAQRRKFLLAPLSAVVVLLGLAGAIYTARNQLLAIDIISRPIPAGDSEALQTALSKGGKVKLTSGEYRLTGDFAPDTSIFGEPGTLIVISGPDCIDISANTFLIQYARISTEKGGCMNVSEGDFTLQNVTIEAEDSQPIHLGGTAIGTLSSTRITGSRGIALTVSGSAQVTAESLDISNVQGSAISLSDTASFEGMGIEVYETLLSGVAVENSAKLVLSESRFTRIGGDAILLMGGDATLSGLAISLARNDGLSVRGGATARFSNGEITSISGRGIFVGEGGRAEIADSRITRSGKVGLEISRGGEVEVLDTIVSDGATGIAAQSGSKLFMRESRVQRNRVDGLLIEDGADALLISNEIEP